MKTLIDVGCVLFDLDGTLIDTIDLIQQSFDYAVKTVLGLSLPRAKLLQNIGRPLLTQMQSFSPAKADKLMDAYNRHNLANHDRHIRPYPDAAEILRWLKTRKRVKTAVVTSKKRQLSLRGLEITGLLPFIDELVAMEDTTHHKPEPEPVLEALRRLGCRGENAVFIGDSPFDMAAGRAAGVRIAAALWGPFDPEQLRDFKPEAELAGLSELKRLLV